MSRFKLDPFVIALALTVLAALVWPVPGVTDGPLHADKAASYGVAFIFILYGLSLAPDQLWKSVGRWRVHLVVQCATFVLFPVVVLAAHPLLLRVMPPEMVTGFFFLAALPSTVSSSVAMTSLARGNVPVAIFNASISSLIGVFITPLLMAWYMHATGGQLDLEGVIIKLVLLVMLPVGIGQMLRPVAASFIARHKRAARIADRAVILMIVYNSFCDSVAGGVWSRHDTSLIIEMVVGVVALFFVVYGLLSVICRIIGFNYGDRIAVLFCGSKKSLATGLPMASVIFGAQAELSLIIAPVMLFHFIQLVLVSFIASHNVGRLERAEAQARAQAAGDGPLPEPRHATK
ncbi:putative Na+-dependent transporter [Azorhizobium caulinodans ORS 571]|uniref:Putative Na+-dependent transporter n=1 Tax=Azorhizobium caulinodans (strain ATCC 43989 / DSM 5975 / JCM 20966 / LMG 6465 / NBRC 14845 / NCIMB 13405 / ORS 571) TaxID=438753 RepID=A8IDH4_AZOC5|nr:MULTISPECIES: bile acid:sodium symporter family protein [Azorhizobium]TDT93392.1 sodium/bile acid cotransporter 7 [Azorhizobium sp. AG788]BAF88938.1 putative Na+-dependent transporter [Azorhizobium caulinodans ORS 571]